MKLHFPYVNMPDVFVSLLKAEISVNSSPDPVFASIRPQRALYSILERAFKEFDDGRGIEKVLMALGWPNFRDRMASIYLYKTVYGDYPSKTNMDLVEEIKFFEERFRSHSVATSSRLFLLGFYLKLANQELQRREENQFLEIKIPEEVESVLRLSQGRSPRLDWLILIVYHLQAALGQKMLTSSLAAGKKFDEIYELMSTESQQQMLENLLAYGASIQESDVFLYDKV